VSPSWRAGLPNQFSDSSVTVELGAAQVGTPELAHSRTGRFETLNSCLFRCEADIAAALQHLAADTASECTDRFFRDVGILGEPYDETVAAIMAYLLLHRAAAVRGSV
jgi:hypothetical protein